MTEQPLCGNNRNRRGYDGFGGFAILIEPREGGGAAPFVGAQNLHQSSRPGRRYLIGADLAVMNEVEIASGVAGLIDNSFGRNLNAMSRKDGLTQKGVKR